MGGRRLVLTLDRETEALLYWASSATASPLWTLSPDAAREEYRRTLAKTEIVPPEIAEVADLTVSGPAARMRLRKYVSKDAGRAGGAAILFIHGGGCVLGDIDSHDILCRTLSTTRERWCFRSTIGSRQSTRFLPRWKTPSRR